jgi:hypothetical protein
MQPPSSNRRFPERVGLKGGVIVVSRLRRRLTETIERVAIARGNSRKTVPDRFTTREIRWAGSVIGVQYQPAMPPPVNTGTRRTVDSPAFAGAVDVVQAYAELAMATTTRY